MKTITKLTDITEHIIFEKVIYSWGRSVSGTVHHDYKGIKKIYVKIYENNKQYMRNILFHEIAHYMYTRGWSKYENEHFAECVSRLYCGIKPRFNKNIERYYLDPFYHYFIQFTKYEIEVLANDFIKRNIVLLDDISSWFDNIFDNKLY